MKKDYILIFSVCIIGLSNTVRSEGFLDGNQVRKTSFINFDKKYGVCLGTELVNNIYNVKFLTKKGGMILFKSEIYDFKGKGLNLTKGITLRGYEPKNIDKTKIGAYDVVTTFKIWSLNMTSSNIKLENLKLKSFQNKRYVFTRFAHPTYNRDEKAVLYIRIPIHS